MLLKVVFSFVIMTQYYLQLCKRAESHEIGALICMYVYTRRVKTNFFRATLTKIHPIKMNHIWTQISYVLLMKHI